MATTNIRHHNFPINSSYQISNHRTTIRAFQEVAHDTQKSSKKTTRLAESISNMLHLRIEKPAPMSLNNITSSLVHVEEKHNTPTLSPKEDISDKWRQIQGSSGWGDLLDPLHPCLRREILKYGEFAQATYDAFDFDSFSEYCGSCRFSRNNLFNKLGLDNHGYDVSKYIYAMSHVDVPQWLKKSHIMDSWSKDSNWMGYVAVSDDKESRRIGRRDIVVAWRGTVAPTEWYEDLQRKLEPIGEGEAKVEHGFLGIYKSKNESTRYNKSSASEQVIKAVKKLVNLYKERGEEVSVTITGHSLGGALAVLNAYETASLVPDVPITVVSFGAPRVGNIAFRDELHKKGVKTLRIVVKQDFVPRMPGIVLNESLQKFDDITGTLEWVYTHVGAELKLDVRASPYLKRGFNVLGYHSLETYLHLVDGFVSTKSSFRTMARRDVALVNKACDMLVEELRIPHFWYQMANKGLVCNNHGRWVKPKRDPEDVPSPTREGQHNVFHQIESNYQRA
ncbi:Fungal lipase-like domain containing protein [Heracleum sosnowskyi]|uniref:Fungal lipase-like domain containing protein n=1 Tax=Heracleum sosnowskyi TaxID=360622 RepID=A0AAD8HMF9_9APIA|nr:Fungal lipase-like domain containing protein [Heracleum sosnowskyi]